MLILWGKKRIARGKGFSFSTYSSLIKLYILNAGHTGVLVDPIFVCDFLLYFDMAGGKTHTCVSVGSVDVKKKGHFVYEKLTVKCLKQSTSAKQETTIVDVHARRAVRETVVLS